eukprot:SAG25_NODE_1657_length_2595_cov_1.657051_2_plen_201_part_00
MNRVENKLTQGLKRSGPACATAEALRQCRRGLWRRLGKEGGKGWARGRAGGWYLKVAGGVLDALGMHRCVVGGARPAFFGGRLGGGLLLRHHWVGIFGGDDGLDFIGGGAHHEGCCLLDRLSGGRHGCCERCCSHLKAGCARTQQQITANVRYCGRTTIHSTSPSVWTRTSPPSVLLVLHNSCWAHSALSTAVIRVTEHG